MIEPVKRVIVLTHGINNTVEDARWLNDLKAYLDTAIHTKGLAFETQVLIHRYNPFVLRYFTFLPFLSKRWRSNQVVKFQKYIAWVRKAYGSSITIDVVAHSFGTYKAHYAMTHDSKQPKAFYGRLILIGAVVSSRFKPEEAAGHFTEEHYFWSDGDSAVAKSPIGNVGWAGPYYTDNKRSGPKIYGYDFSSIGHSDYFKQSYRSETFQRVAGILGLE